MACVHGLNGSSEFRLVSFNMHGFFQGLPVVDEIITSVKPEIILLQEHWLTPDNLIRFEQHFNEYFSFGGSAMANQLESGMLRGRPYGGVMALIRKGLRSYTQLIHCDDRFVVVRVANYLIVNIYLPCSGTKDRLLMCNNILADIVSWRDLFADCHFVIAGDLNVDLDSLDTVASHFNNFAHSCCLHRCDEIFPDSKMSTYVNIALGHNSCIDYVLTTCPSDVMNFVILEPDINYSDHLPLLATFNNLDLSEYPVKKPSQATVQTLKQLRWDHADLAAYYILTGDQLFPVMRRLDSLLSDYENHILHKHTCCNLIDTVYDEIVAILQSAAETCVPQRRKYFYKFWWDEELECLKQDSIESNQLWKAAGKPRFGSVFDRRQSCRLLYRKRLREEQRNESLHYTNELHDALIAKNGAAFWKCWKSKFNSSPRCEQVDGCTD